MRRELGLDQRSRRCEAGRDAGRHPRRPSADRARSPPHAAPRDASPLAGAPPVSLKLECLQHSGSFKARGAFHNLLTRPAPPAGCATASGGNHGAAVAYAARAARRHGACVRAGDRDPGEDRQDPGLRRRGRRRRRDPTPRRRRSATPMSPRAARCRSTPTTRPRRSPAPARSRSNGRRTSRGSACRRSTRSLVAVGGGGLIAGVAAWFAGRVKVVGVEPEGSRALHAALEAGRAGRRRGPVDRRRFARRATGRRSQLRHRPPGVRRRGRARPRRGDRRGAAPPVARRLDRRRAGRRRGLRRALERRLSAGEGRARRRPRLRRERRSRGVRRAGVKTRGRSWRPRQKPTAAIAAGESPNYCPPAFRGPFGPSPLGRRQAVRQRILIPPSPGSNPARPSQCNQ